MVETGHEKMTAGQQLADLVNGRIIPAVAELRSRWEKLYPAVRNSVRSATMVCDQCGHRISALRMGDLDIQQQVLSGRHLGHPDHDSPDEYVTRCPECGATESFREGIDE
ncbi:MAG: zinc ribbon-containing protein [bacterium]|nr:zinc ribbon-containing protein [bacterium]